MAQVRVWYRVTVLPIDAVSSRGKIGWKATELMWSLWLVKVLVMVQLRVSYTVMTLNDAMASIGRDGWKARDDGWKPIIENGDGLWTSNFWVTAHV